MVKQKKKIILIIFLITVALALTIALLVKNSNRIIKNELEKALGKNFSVERISLTWGAVEADGIKFKQGTEVTAEAGKLGLSVVEVGERVVVMGTGGVKGIGRGLKSIGTGVEKIFRK